MSYSAGKVLVGAMAACVFTGLVQIQGKLLTRSPRGRGLRLSVAHDLGPLELGESVAVNGVCLTVAASQPQRFDADASTETVSRSNLGQLPIGSSVHLERALRVGDRFGGHIVAGHVDALVRLLDVTQSDAALELVFEQPDHLLPFIAEKGSVAIDGVSLTVNRITSSSFSVMVVPHTQRATHLTQLRIGATANVEVDVLARYIVHLARLGLGAREAGEMARPEPNPDAAERDASLLKILNRAGIV